jgi:hypothetical protein
MSTVIQDASNKFGDHINGVINDVISSVHFSELFYGAETFIAAAAAAAAAVRTMRA